MVDMLGSDLVWNGFSDWVGACMYQRHQTQWKTLYGSALSLCLAVAILYGSEKKAHWEQINESNGDRKHKTWK